MIYRLIRAARVGDIFSRLLFLAGIIGLAIGAIVILLWAIDSPIKVYGKRPDPAKSPPKADATGKVATCPTGRFLVRFPPGTEPELICLNGSLPSWEKPNDALKKGGRQ